MRPHRPRRSGERDGRGERDARRRGRTGRWRAGRRRASGGGGPDGGTAPDASIPLRTDDGSVGDPSARPDSEAPDVPPGACVEGTNLCVSADEVGICQGGVVTPAFACPMGCIEGVCAECLPGTTQCTSATAQQLCTADGIWSTTMPCNGACTNGACLSTACVEGDTRCASVEAQQTCTGGVWTTASNCEYVCVGKACGMNTKTVFVTSQTFPGGGLGGLPGADAICERLANASGRMGTYLAWLSDATGSPAARFSENGGPYELTDGTEIAHNWTELTEAGLVNGITTTELRTMPPNATAACGPASVWTDTRSDGTLNDVRLSCDDWSNLMGLGAGLGVAGGALGWTDACDAMPPMTPVPCAASAALYCFEQ